MKAAVIMGSASDASKVEGCIQILKDFGVEVSVRALSAHRAHEALSQFVEECNNDGTEVIITAAGMAAALPGVVASQTVLPVIGVQMPSGIPVATVAINGGKNAAYLALQIMANKHASLKEQLLAHRKQMNEACLKTNEEISKKY